MWRTPHLPNRKIAQMRRVFFEELGPYSRIQFVLVYMSLAVLYLYWYCIILVSPFNLLCYMFLTQKWRPLHLTHQKLSQMHHITLHSRQVNPRFYTKMGKLNINLKYTWTFETIAKFQDINFSSTINPNETSKKKWS